MNIFEDKREIFEKAKRELRFLIPESNLSVDYLVSEIITSKILLNRTDKKESRFPFADVKPEQRFLEGTQQHRQQ